MSRTRRFQKHMQGNTAARETGLLMKVGDQLLLPRRYSFVEEVNGNPIRCLLHTERLATVAARRISSRDKPDGFVLQDATGTSILLLDRKPNGDEGFETILTVKKGSLADGQIDPGSIPIDARWAGPTEGAPGWRPLTAYAEQARTSWEDTFTFREEVRDTQGQITASGLRPPQIGALFAALAHWRGTADPATIVMPTGTGKTETMLAILARERMPRLLVVVPSNALRGQIAEKFETLGLLKQLGILGQNVLFPVVCTLLHRPRTTDEVEHLFMRSNVVVASMQALQGCSRDVQERISTLCRDLFIDEAHHAPAPTWDAFRKIFLGQTCNRILQFTATPFRTDGKLVEGRVIFNYPLIRAQADGYFVPIRLRAVMAWDQASADEAIASAALEQLDDDLAAGFPHVVMARTDTIQRALDIVEIYKRIAPGHEPTLIHSEIGAAKRQEAIDRLRSGVVKIIVCVDMLGEGFDFPNLKIAAVHDPHKSLAITLQFTGRFTRAHSTVGQATVVVNVADPDMEDRLRDLYAEDADWNQLLTELSTSAVSYHTRRTEFLDGFTGPTSPIALQNVFPKMSAVVYRTFCATWHPGRVETAIRKRARIYAGPLWNIGQRTLIFITEEQEPVPWGAVKEVSNTIWHLYLLHWDENRGLLFINSSDNSSIHEGLAKAVCGDDVRILKGDTIFRALYGIDRLVVMNLGLNHAIGRAVRFTMHNGSDVGQAMTEASLGNRTRSNLFGMGYENGAKASIGCSRKGRIWSYQVAYDIGAWITWCHRIGVKLLDSAIKPEDVFRWAMIPEPAITRPRLVPMAIEWDDEVLRRPERVVMVEIGDMSVPLYEVDLRVLDHNDSGPLRFQVSFSVAGEIRFSEFEVQFSAAGVRHVHTEGKVAFVSLGGKRTGLADWFRDNPPSIYFANGALLLGDDLFTPSGMKDRIPYSRERIDAWDWTGTNIRVESQTEHRLPNSIQFRVIQTLLAAAEDDAFDIVFDDDGKGEAADVVAIKIRPNRIIVHLYHCKYSGGDRPGARLGDLYEVCGQAQKSVRWRADTDALLRHLQLREGQRLARRAPSRFERGDLNLLRRLENQLRSMDREFRVFIVQPGLSRKEAETEHLELLAATEAYLVETFRLPLGVMASV